MISKWQGVVSILRAHNGCYEQVLKPSQIAVHPSNRGGLGLNPRNAHKVGAAIKLVGGDLEDATCFEIPHGLQCDNQMMFNRELVEHSEGLLTPL